MKHIVNGDRIGGWYCYQCKFFTRDVEEAAKHDGMRDVSPSERLADAITSTLIQHGFVAAIDRAAVMHFVETEIQQHNFLDTDKDLK